VNLNTADPSHSRRLGSLNRVGFVTQLRYMLGRRWIPTGRKEIERSGLVRARPKAVAQGGALRMTDNSVVRARIDERTKREAAAARKKIGLILSDALRLLPVRVAAEKALPFEPLNPNAETVVAMKAARRGELVKVGKPGKLALGA